MSGQQGTTRWYELLVAARLLRSRRSAHLSIISAMSVAGIALGVGALIVVLAVNTGFQVAFQERILSTYPHVVVMRRGLEMQDHREGARRLMVVSGTRTATPATYDDMMLASANGRAGAAVRGVPSSTQAAMPARVVAKGQLDLHGEAPLTELDADAATLRVVRGTASARHALVIDRADHVHSLALMPPQSGMSGLLVFDASGCGETRSGGEALELYNDFGGEVVRRLRRDPQQPACGVIASWETLSGDFELRWTHGEVPQTLRLTLPSQATTALVIDGARTLQVAPVHASTPPTVAALAVVQTGNAALAITLPDGTTATVAGASASPWMTLEGPLPAIALGEGLAKRLQVDIGDEVRAVSPLRGLDGGGGATTSGAAGRFRVVAVIRTGFYDHDQRLAMVDFTAAQRFLGRGDVARWVELRVDDPILASSRSGRYRSALDPVPLSALLSDVQAMRGQLHRIQTEVVSGLELGDGRDALGMVDNWVSGVRAARQARTRGGSLYRVIDWEEMNRNIFDAARMQKIAMSLFPFIIVLVAALNVIGTQAVVVHERARDIAIMRAMGATPRSVGAIFLTQGLAVGLLGTAVGLGLGGLCCLLLSAVGYPLDPHVYLISELPVQVEASTFILAGGAATALSFAAAWASARRAAERSPVEGLRRLD